MIWTPLPLNSLNVFFSIFSILNLNLNLKIIKININDIQKLKKDRESRNAKIYCFKFGNSCAALEKFALNHPGSTTQARGVPTLSLRTQTLATKDWSTNSWLMYQIATKKKIKIVGYMKGPPYWRLCYCHCSGVNIWMKAGVT